MKCPEHLRDEIAAIEDETGVRFTAVCDPAEAVAKAKTARRYLIEYFRWYRSDGRPRRLRKDGKPYGYDRR